MNALKTCTMQEREGEAFLCHSGQSRVSYGKSYASQGGSRYLHIADSTHPTTKACAKAATAKAGEVLEVAHVEVLVGACLILLILIYPLVPVHL